MLQTMVPRLASDIWMHPAVGRSEKPHLVSLKTALDHAKGILSQTNKGRTHFRAGRPQLQPLLIGLVVQALQNWLCSQPLPDSCGFASNSTGCRQLLQLLPAVLQLHPAEHFGKCQPKNNRGHCA